LNIVLLGHQDIASLFALNRLVDLSPDHHYTAFNSGELAPKDTVPKALAELALADRALHDQYLAEFPVTTVLRTATELPAPNSPEGLQALAGCDPDLIVSIRYRRILREQAIAIPRKGVLNLHSGILPDYRGVMATFWAMLNEEPEIGATLHWIVDSGIDTGPEIGISRARTRPEESYLANVLRLTIEGCKMMAAAVETVNSRKIRRNALLAMGQGRYYSSPDAVAIERFSAKGLKLVLGDELDLIS